MERYRYTGRDGFEREVLGRKWRRGDTAELETVPADLLERGVLELVATEPQTNETEELRPRRRRRRSRKINPETIETPEGDK